jgi:hypothetical protein
MKYVVDTNVLVVANGRARHATPSCVSASVQMLGILERKGTIVLGDEWHILGEYGKTLGNNRQQPGVGDAFLKWVLTNQANPGRCEQVHITPRGNSFAEFPNDPTLQGFDPSDHKFVAVSCAHPEHPPILNAVDSDWKHVRQALAFHGVTVEELC